MVILLLLIVGLGLGSFVNALVWRLHEQETGNKDKSLSILKGRSMCPNCKHQLHAKDLVPVFSWLRLGGKCRYCKAPISWQYPLVELLTAAIFISSYLYWPHGFTTVGVLQFLTWLICVVLFMALIVYDLRWMILPDRVVFILVAITGLQTLLLAAYTADPGSLLAALLSVLCTAGFFWVMFQLSAGKWIGGGDVKLAVALGLLLAGPLQATLMLFIASLAGCVVSIPLVLQGKAGKGTKIPFGPFLIGATIIVYLFGEQIVHAYEMLIFGA